MKSCDVQEIQNIPSFHISNRNDVHYLDKSQEGEGFVEVENEEPRSEEDARTSEGTSDKKTDEVNDPPKAPSGGYLWRFSSGLVNTSAGAVTGAVGYGFGGIKWVASKGYSAGTAVIGTTKTVASKVSSVPKWKKKDKKE